MTTDLSTARWFTSTRSGDAGHCVEIAHLDGGLIGVRDSKNPHGPALVFHPADWETFTGTVATGTFDLA